MTKINLSKNAYILLSILFFALIVRVYKIGNYELWFDERASLSCALGIPYVGIIQRKDITWEDLNIDPSSFTTIDFEKFNTIRNTVNAAFQDTGAVAYFLSLHFWIKFFGRSDSAVRSLSIMFNLLSIIILYFLTTFLFDKKYISYLACFLFIIHPLMLSESQFARSHSMATFFSLISSYYFFRMIDSKEKHGKIKYRQIFFYGFFSSMILFSHLFSIYILLGQIIVSFVFVRNWKTWKNLIIAGLVALVFFSGWLVIGGFDSLQSSFITDNLAREKAQNWNSDDNPYYMPASLKSIIAGWTQQILAIYGNYLQNLGLRLKFLILSLLLPIILITTGFRININNPEVRRKTIILIILSISSPLLATVISLKVQHIITFAVHYSKYSVPYAIIVLAFFFYEVINKNKINWAKYCFSAIVTLQVVVMLISLYAIYIDHSRKRNVNVYPKIATYVEGTYIEGDTLLYKNWEYAHTLNVYFKKDNNIPQRIDPDLIDPIVIVNKIKNSYKILLFDDNNVAFKFP